MTENKKTKAEKQEVLLQVENLKKYFTTKGSFGREKSVKAVEHVTFSINRGDTFGLVGESGCGKTTLGRAVLRLHEPTDGKIIYNGTPIFDGSLKQQPDMKPYRRKMQIIFQDPSASLDPRMTVGEIVGEALDIHKICANRKDRTDRINELLSKVGLNSEHSNRYPHEFSGGQQQRIGIARALAVQPEFIVCDEPISALDVSIQAQIVNMLEDMQEEMNLTYLFIAHDLSVVKHISDRIGVMYLGNMVEVGKSNEIYSQPVHPYTKTLLSAVPVPDPRVCRTKKRIILEGEIPNPMNPPSGCRFHTRCPNAADICSQEIPQWKEIEKGHFAACHLF